MLAKKAIKRGNFNSKEELNSKIMAFIDYFNESMANFLVKALFILIVSVFFCFSLKAEEVLVTADTQNLAAADQLDDEADMNQLLAIIDQQTDIATTTKLNADYVPGIVTVLQGDDLEARGILTVEDALKLIPGFNISVVGNGYTLVNVRGYNEELFAGNVKFMINSMTLNPTLSGKAIPILSLPTPQIDRIEIIRGPGSALHGQNAYSGVVNVITRKEGNHIFLNKGSFDTHRGGGIFSWSSAEGDVDVSANISAWETEGADIKTGNDFLHGIGLASISQAPGKVNLDNEQLMAGLSFRYKDFTFNTQYLEVAFGDPYGSVNALPPETDSLTTRHHNWVSELRQKIQVFSSLDAELKLGWRKHHLTVTNSFIFPPGFPNFPNGTKFGLGYDGSELNGGIDLKWKQWQDHNLLLSWSFLKTTTDGTYQDTNFIPSTGATLPTVQRFTGNESWSDEHDRLVNSVLIQDEYKIHPQVTLTGSLRYDFYDDVGNILSPRFATVWRLNDNNILKFQYARAFRPPTFQELYNQNNPVARGTQNLDFVTIDTYELGYVYKLTETTARTTLFWSDIQNGINFTNGDAGNRVQARLMGVELELEQKLHETLKLNTNVSYSHTRDLQSNQELTNSVNWLANVGLFYQPLNNLILDVQYRYVGDRNRDPIDSRGSLRGYQTINLTGNLFNLGIQGITLRAGVSNLLDEKVFEPAPANTYPEDYPRTGREWWVQLSATYN